MQQESNKTQTRGQFFSERSKTRLSASDYALFQRILKERDELFPGSHGLYRKIADKVEESTGVRPNICRVSYTLTGRKIYEAVAEAFFAIANQERERAKKYATELV